MTLSLTTGSSFNDKLFEVVKEVEELKSEISGGSTLIDQIYPVGSIYVSMNSTNPSELFEGTTWEQITDRFLYCANSSKETGGSSTITTANLPAHTHTFTGTKSESVVDVAPGVGGYNVLTNTTAGALNVSARSGTSASYGISFASDSEKNDTLTFNYTPSGTISSTGSGEEFLPPYITVYAWYRTA